jgi:hypothetical protein
MAEAPEDAEAYQRLPTRAGCGARLGQRRPSDSDASDSDASDSDGPLLT